MIGEKGEMGLDNYSVEGEGGANGVGERTDVKSILVVIPLLVNLIWF
jgi:hypothetical protein